MAHGLESRVPFLDHALVEFAATMPADVKFKDGQLKHVLQASRSDASCPRSIAERTDKMGFPVPLRSGSAPAARCATSPATCSAARPRARGRTWPRASIPSR